MDWVDKPQNYKDLYGILQLLRGSHLNNFRLKALKVGWVAFYSIAFQLKCLDFQSDQYKKLVPVLSRFCNWQFSVIVFQLFTVYATTLFPIVDLYLGKYFLISSSWKYSSIQTEDPYQTSDSVHGT